MDSTSASDSDVEPIPELSSPMEETPGCTRLYTGSSLSVAGRGPSRGGVLLDAEDGTSGVIVDGKRSRDAE